MNEPTHLDICAGIGGFAIAFEAAGFRTIGFAEILPLPSAVLKRHWPNVPNLGDIRKIHAGAIARPNVLTGGIPCEPASLAGQRRGESDERWLWSEAVRLVREFRPDFAVFENPPGILTLDGGYAFERILCAIHASGYDLWWETIPAFAVGADHERERVFIIAHDMRFRREGFSQRGSIRQVEQCRQAADAHSNQINGHACGHGAGEVCWQRSAETKVCASQSDADAFRIGNERGRITRRDEEGKRPPCSTPGLPQIPTNPNRPRLENRKGKQGHDGEKLPPIERDTRFTLPETDFELLRTLHGAAVGLDRHQRIEALGKTVVPAVVYPIARAIRQLY